MMEAELRLDHQPAPALYRAVRWINCTADGRLSTDRVAAGNVGEHARQPSVDALVAFISLPDQHEAILARRSRARYLSGAFAKNRRLAIRSTCGIADSHNLTLLSRSALVMTVKEDSAIAAPANIGDRRMPAIG